MYICISKRYTVASHPYRGFILPARIFTYRSTPIACKMKRRCNPRCYSPTQRHCHTRRGHECHNPSRQPGLRPKLQSSEPGRSSCLRRCPYGVEVELAKDYTRQRDDGFPTGRQDIRFVMVLSKSKNNHVYAALGEAVSCSNVSLLFVVSSQVLHVPPRGRL